MVVQRHGNCVQLECKFLPGSSATGCGLFLINLSGEAGTQHTYHRLQRESGMNTASDCVDVGKEGRVTVIAFAYVNNTLNGRPYVIKDQYLGKSSRVL